MKLVISGYGANPANTIALYSFKDSNLEMQWQTSVENPSYLCEEDGYLFTVTEAQNYACVYLFQRTTSGYQLLDQKTIEGGDLCHITYSKKNKALFGACYGTGTLFSIRVEEGGFGDILFHEVQVSEKLTKTPVSLTRAHCVLLNKEESMLLVINIELDRIYFYEIHEGFLKLVRTLDTPSGTGPRHAIYSADERFIYIITEYSNEIFIYGNNSTMDMLQRVSTLSPNYTGISKCSTLCFSKEGTFLYAANRGADTIAVFTVKKDGTLELIQQYDCEGKHPRHMIISQDGRYLIICNQFSDNIIVFELDEVTGGLINKVTSLDFSSPSGIVQVK